MNQESKDLGHKIDLLQTGVRENQETVEDLSTDIDRLYETVMALCNILEAKKIASYDEIGEAIKRVQKHGTAQPKK